MIGGIYMDDKKMIQNTIKEQKENCEKQLNVQQELIMKVYELLEKMFEEEEIRDIDFEVLIKNESKTSFCEGSLKISVNVLGHDQMRVSTGCRSSSPFTLLKRE